MEEVTSEKRFKCHICSKTFTRQNHLVKHERIHTGEKPFECDICGTKFSDPSTLRKHQNIHTGEKNFKCEVCGKQFTQKSNLSLHLKIHTGEKDFVCNICERPFTQKSHLDQHMVVHAGEKLYSCDGCGKSFASRSGSNSHKNKCKGKSSLQQNETASTEDEMNPLDDPLTVKSENYEDVVESGEISLESELEAESIDCKETIKLKIKHEIQDTEYLQDPLSTEV